MFLIVLLKLCFKLTVHGRTLDEWLFIEEARMATRESIIRTRPNKLEQNTQINFIFRVFTFFASKNGLISKSRIESFFI